MSKVRIPINPMQVGKVGAYSMYVRKGEQIVRQRKNSSNYGSEASRTTPQQERRAKWGNIVNVYKALKHWQPKAWETATAGKTDYNEFVSKNINSSRIYLTKDMCGNGCAVMGAYMVSQGSLPPLVTEYSTIDNVFDTHITLSEAPGPNKTLGFVSEDILTNNPEFQDGDNIGLVFFSQMKDERNYPYLRTRYYEITLDSQSTAQLSANPVYELIDLTSEGSLCFVSPQLPNWTDVGFVAIHTRKTSGLQVSTQKVVISDPQFIELFDTEDAMLAAVASYGQENEVPLEPSFSEGSIDSVLVDGAPITRDFIYDRAIELTVKGENMQGHVTLDNGSVTYTPLSVSADGGEWTYILSSDGEYTVRLNGRKVRTVTIEGIVIPAELGLLRQIGQAATEAAVMSDAINIHSDDAVCINYPHRATAEYGFFRFSVGFSEEPDSSDIVGHGCTISHTGYIASGSRFSLSAQPSSLSDVCYITYKGVIVAVFNYE